MLGTSVPPKTMNDDPASKSQTHEIDPGASIPKYVTCRLSLCESVGNKVELAKRAGYLEFFFCKAKE